MIKILNGGQGEKMHNILIFFKKLLNQEAGMESAELAVVAGLVIFTGFGVWAVLGAAIQKALTDLLNFLI